MYLAIGPIFRWTESFLGEKKSCQLAFYKPLALSTVVNILGSSIKKSLMALLSAFDLVLFLAVFEWSAEIRRLLHTEINQRVSFSLYQQFYCLKKKIEGK